MSGITLYASYFIAQQRRIGQHHIEKNIGSVRPMFPTESEERISESQRQAIKEFIDKNASAQLLEKFVEVPDNLRTNKWPQLERAIDFCKQQNATLIIAELGTLPNNETFTKLLLDSGINFYCIDQPFVDSNILEALFKHAQIQRKLHGQLIRKGLKMTSAKSGNPNAAEVISKVNKPKIDTAIVFAFLLQPVIADYRRKGYSQRQMVKTLNEEGFTAPEGGKWVLSQLQKVLDRVRLNEVATEFTDLFTEFKQQGLSPAEIAEKLNQQGLPSLKHSSWDETQVKRLISRLEQINDIELINTFVLDILPILHEYSKQGLTALEILSKFEQNGINIKQSQEEVAA